MNPRTSIPSVTSSGSASPGSLGEPLYRFPTSLAQQSIWYLDRLAPGNPCWNIAVRFRLVGPLGVPLLQRSIDEVVRRHDVLRTSFALIDGTLAQIVHSEAAIPLPLDDLSSLAPPIRDAEEERRTIAEAALPFNLKSGPLLRVRLLKLDKKEHMLLLTIHHIVSDGWSIGLFSDEIAAHYEALSLGNPSTSPDLPLQYADYTIWKRSEE